MSIVNKYKMKPGISMDDILNELREKNLPIGTHGTYISKDAKYSTFKHLIDDIEVCIAFPEDLSVWDDFDHILVMDDNFGQPYYPFYKIEEKQFPFVLNVAGCYNKFMDTLSFLEKENINRQDVCRGARGNLIGEIADNGIVWTNTETGTQTFEVYES